MGFIGAHHLQQSLIQVFLAVDCSPAGDVYGGGPRLGRLWFASDRSLLLPGMKDFLWQRLKNGIINITVERWNGRWGAHLKNGGVPSTTIGVCVISTLTKRFYAMDDFLEAQAFLRSLEWKDGAQRLIWLKIIKHKEVARDGEANLSLIKSQPCSSRFEWKLVAI